MTPAFLSTFYQLIPTLVENPYFCIVVLLAEWGQWSWGPRTRRPRNPQKSMILYTSQYSIHVPLQVVLHGQSLSQHLT